MHRSLHRCILAPLHAYIFMCGYLHTSIRASMQAGIPSFMHPCVHVSVPCIPVFPHACTCLRSRLCFCLCVMACICVLSAFESVDICMRVDVSLRAAVLMCELRTLRRLMSMFMLPCVLMLVLARRPGMRHSTRAIRRVRSRDVQAERGGSKHTATDTL